MQYPVKALLQSGVFEGKTTAEELATLVWELELEDQTCIYGDNDRLPTGNLLASAWPSVISADASFQYDAREYYYEHEYEYYLYKYYYY